MKKKVHLTCNQAMVLLDIYRGTFVSRCQHPTVENDLAFLSKSNLVFLDKGEFTTTPSGDDRVKEILW